MKTCKQCKLDLPLTSYYSNGPTKGLKARCTSCIVSKQRAKRQADQLNALESNLVIPGYRPERHIPDSYTFEMRYTAALASIPFSVPRPEASRMASKMALST